ncbi:MAG: alpha/beta hydrolase [Pseudorhodoplanes sp.]|uniref:alpha/beta hydrolase n=1 Tax=Pseudorhodoplanes sp. TaxID=1934341 RepID=UPI003D0ED662
MKIEAAAPRRRFVIALEDGAEVVARVYGKGPRLVLSHGNGLAIDAYETFWQRLTGRYEVVMFDFRHHGLSTAYREPLQNWPQFIRDFDVVTTAIQCELGPAEAVGIFHSMSALTALIHASEYPTTWRGIVAFEPPVPPRPEHEDFEPFFSLHRDLAEGAARRRVSFESPERLATSFGSRPSFKRIDPQDLQRLSAATLRRNAQSGRYDLACAREFESETFRLRNLGDAWGRVGAASLPVHVVAGNPSSDENQCLATVACRIAQDGGFGFEAVADSTHFLQIERPAECVTAVERFIASL